MIQLVPGRLAKPDWLKAKVALPNARFKNIQGVVKDLKLSTVCQEAQCPNIAECWGGGTATFMLMGDTCTRACKFCNVNHGKPQLLDPEEPKHLAEAIAKLKLDYAVITCVDRDDVPDGGASHFASCITYLKQAQPELLIEILVSDFQGKHQDTQKVIDAQPHVYGHNIETVERLQKSVRDHRANYKQSLGVLEYVKKSTAGSQKMYTKSAIMVGLGETPEEVIQTMKDLRTIDVDFLTIGQYLRPSAWNLPVKEYVPPDQYKEYERIGKELGFIYVAAGPFVRSSYRAGELFIKNVLKSHDIMRTNVNYR
ncbi:lipoyl synthase [Candidatus Gracilibacteria bacterium]|nr:lipoyl synthase [Candidatus Gracilibacteria bacterium]